MYIVCEDMRALDNEREVTRAELFPLVNALLTVYRGQQQYSREMERIDHLICKLTQIDVEAHRLWERAERAPG